jgi:hypothetical protein
MRIADLGEEATRVHFHPPLQPAAEPATAFVGLQNACGIML